MLGQKLCIAGTMKHNQQLYSYPRIGVAVIVTHQQKVLFGKRIVTNGDSEWQLPGGWIELGESPEQTARREVAEETGLGLDELKLVGLTNNYFSDQNHSISLYFEAECANPERIKNREPGKCEQWVWMGWQEVQKNLYLPLQLLKDTDYRPFSTDKHGIHVSF
jgi:8-oxo-dGTP diphosphatase